VQVALPCAGDTRVLAGKSDHWHLEAGISNREVAYRVCDKLSRESGRLVRLVLFQDLTGVSPRVIMRHRRIANVQAHLAELQDVLYPQLLHKVLLTHPGPFIGAIFRIARPFLSEKLLARTRVAHRVHVVMEESPLPMHNVPAFIGGSSPWRPVWVPDTMPGLPDKAAKDPSTARDDPKGRRRRKQWPLVELAMRAEQWIKARLARRPVEG